MLETRWNISEDTVRMVMRWLRRLKQNGVSEEEFGRIIRQNGWAMGYSNDDDTQENWVEMYRRLKA